MKPEENDMTKALLIWVAALVTTVVVCFVLIKTNQPSGQNFGSASVYRNLEVEQQRYLAENGEYLQVERTDKTLNSTHIKRNGYRPVKDFDMSTIPANSTMRVFTTGRTRNNDTSKLNWGFEVYTEYDTFYEYYKHDTDGTITLQRIDKEMVIGTSTKEIEYKQLQL